MISIPELERLYADAQRHTPLNDFERMAVNALPALIAAVHELDNQWLYNHSEHCRNEWPHEGECYWPQPDALTAFTFEEVKR